MLITENTTVTDVEKHPFVGITNTPLFLHMQMDEVSIPKNGTQIYDPETFEIKTKRLVLDTRTIGVKNFYGDYKNLVENSKNSGCMVYFQPTEDGYIVDGGYVRMAQVKLTDYEFNKKCNETFNIIVKEETSKNKYTYLLIT